MSDIWARRSSAERWRKRGEAVGSCLVVIGVIALVIGAAGGILFAFVRIVRVAWGH